MKAKSLILAGVISAIGAFSATVQGQTVFSVNAVGFVNKSFNPGFSLAANPLVASDNTVNTLFEAAPAGTQVFKFNPSTGSFSSSTKTIIGWTDPNMTLLPGEAFFLKNIGTSAFTVTFVGNVNQGSLTNSLVAGFNMVSSQVPQAGLIATDLKAPIVPGEQVFRFNGSGYDSFTLTIIGWTPSEPIIDVGEGFFVRKTQAADWSRQFSVNN